MTEPNIMPPYVYKRSFGEAELLSKKKEYNINFLKKVSCSLICQPTYPKLCSSIQIMMHTKGLLLRFIHGGICPSNCNLEVA